MKLKYFIILFLALFVSHVKAKEECLFDYANIKYKYTCLENGFENDISKKTIIEINEYFKKLDRKGFANTKSIKYFQIKTSPTYKVLKEYEKEINNAKIRRWGITLKDKSHLVIDEMGLVTHIIDTTSPLEVLALLSPDDLRQTVLIFKVLNSDLFKEKNIDINMNSFDLRLVIEQLAWKKKYKELVEFLKTNRVFAPVKLQSDYQRIVYDLLCSEIISDKMFLEYLKSEKIIFDNSYLAYFPNCKPSMLASLNTVLDGGVSGFRTQDKSNLLHIIDMDNIQNTKKIKDLEKYSLSLLADKNDKGVSGLQSLVNRCQVGVLESLIKIIVPSEKFKTVQSFAEHLKRNKCNLGYEYFRERKVKLKDKEVENLFRTARAKQRAGIMEAAIMQGQKSMQKAQRNFNRIQKKKMIMNEKTSLIFENKRRGDPINFRRSHLDKRSNFAQKLDVKNFVVFSRISGRAWKIEFGEKNFTESVLIDLENSSNGVKQGFRQTSCDLNDLSYIHFANNKIYKIDKSLNLKVWSKNIENDQLLKFTCDSNYIYILNNSSMYILDHQLELVTLRQSFIPAFDFKSVAIKHNIIYGFSSRYGPSFTIDVSNKKLPVFNSFKVESLYREIEDYKYFFQIIGINDWSFWISNNGEKSYGVKNFSLNKAEGNYGFKKENVRILEEIDFLEQMYLVNTNTEGFLYESTPSLFLIRFDEEQNLNYDKKIAIEFDDEFFNLDIDQYYNSFKTRIKDQFIYFIKKGNVLFIYNPFTGMQANNIETGKLIGFYPIDIKRSLDFTRK